MAGLFQSFGLGSGGSSSDSSSSTQPIERRHKRITPPLSLVRAEIKLPNDKLFVGQLWDISQAGAALSLGRVTFPEAVNSSVLLRLRSRHGPEMLELPAIIRWTDINHGVTFAGLSLKERIQAGTFLDTFLDFSENPLTSYQPRSA